MAKAKTAKAVKAAKVPEIGILLEADPICLLRRTHDILQKKLSAHQSVEDGRKE